MKAFFQTFYTPSNASLAIVGDFDVDEALEQVERYFGDIPSGAEVNRTDRMDTTLTGAVDMEAHDRVQLPRLHLLWPTVPGVYRRPTRPGPYRLHPGRWPKLTAVPLAGL